MIAAVLGFRSSTALGSAYGIAVTGTMLITTLLTFFVVRHAWRLSLWLALAATAFFVLIDLAFFSANLLKVADGGWFPLVDRRASSSPAWRPGPAAASCSTTTCAPTRSSWRPF